MGMFMIVVDLDFESDLLESMGDYERRDRLVVTDRDGLAHQGDVYVRCGDGQLIVESRLDGEDTTRTVKIIDNKVGDSVHVARDGCCDRRDNCCTSRGKALL